ncbi:MAG: hypothetical protein E7658_01665 [Ruminococcaceae bacterium]|nr:hypothetical protein [Oscillospiraceae bacterium]
MKRNRIILKHLFGYDKNFGPAYRIFTADKVVLFTEYAASEKGHHQSRTVVYFFPRFSKLTNASGRICAFSDAGFVPGDRMYPDENERDGWKILKITPFLTGSDRVEHYRLECVK